MKKEAVEIQSKTTFSHDSCFKLFFSRPELAGELLKLVLSKEELEVYNLDDLRYEKETYKNKITDMVLSFSLKKEPKKRVEILTLVEHKSYYDKSLFDQVLNYLVLIREQTIKQKGYALPIFPIIFYHGREPFQWKQSLQEEDFGSLLSEIPVQTRECMLQYKMKVINTQDPEIRKLFTKPGSKIGGVLKLLDGIWNLKNPSSEKVSSIVVNDLGELLEEKSVKERDDIVAGVFEYLKNVAKLKSVEEQRAKKDLISRGILKQGGVMDIREFFREQGREEGIEKGRKEGIQKGMEKGMEKGIEKGMEKGRKEGIEKGIQKGLEKGRQEERREVVLKMLEEKAEISLISKVTGFTEEEIKTIKNRL